MSVDLEAKPVPSPPASQPRPDSAPPMDAPIQYGDTNLSAVLALCFALLSLTAFAYPPMLIVAVLALILASIAWFQLSAAGEYGAGHWAMNWGAGLALATIVCGGGW